VLENQTKAAQEKHDIYIYTCNLLQYNRPKQYELCTAYCESTVYSYDTRPGNGAGLFCTAPEQNTVTREDCKL